ncbi:HAMP domain-containing protein [Marinagarivorans algicola]|uniref:HAMP domain-containing protein n=1 Tax=Marinagarivorans algicola TaxID=1513270 RepID=UPI000B1DA7D9|nr:HAMP domain-containing protein [Marinagarivorans algicola]
MRIFSGISVKWKIYLIAIVSIIGFGSYLAFNVWINTKNTDLLTNVRDTYFPILEKATANGVRLERISELFNTAVLTGELEYLQSAETTANTMNQDFSAILALEPNKKEDIQAIQKNFSDYYNEAKGIAEEMATGEADFATIGQRVKSKEVLLELLESKLESFRKYSHANFSGNINEANKNSEFMLTSGFVIWVSSILVLTMTVYTIASIIIGSIISVSKSLHSIAKSGDVAQNIPVNSADEIGQLTQSFNELMDKLRERTHDLMSMMQNMHQGLFTITEDETIHKEYSAYIEKIFETEDVANTKYDALLFSHANIGSDQMDQIHTAISSLLGADEMMFAFNSHLLIPEYNASFPSGEGQAKTKILELDWDPIISEGTITKIMVTVRDVTELRAMQAEAEEQKQELDILGEIIKIAPNKFTSFIDNARKLLDENQAIIEKHDSKDIEVVANLFVNMHTIKGNARTYQFNAITDLVHEAETTYDRLRKEEAFPWEPATLLHELQLVRDAIEHYAKIKQEKLASNQTAELPAGSILISQDDYKHMLSTCEQPQPSNQAIAKMLRRFDTIPFESAIDDLIASLPSVAKQLNKPAPLIKIELSGLLLHKSYSELMGNVFTHLLRNAIDHGIETAEVRQQKGKVEQGTIYLESTYEKDGATIWLWDDGQGVNLKKLKNKALASGQISAETLEDPSAVANCLFMSGVSTAEEVTAISGRGVGMDAVKKYLQSKGCDIAIVIDENVDKHAELVPFKLKLTLADTLIEHADNTNHQAA